MNNFTKFNIRKTILELAKQLAAEENRSVSNFIENLIIEKIQDNKDNSSK